MRWEVYFTFESLSTVFRVFRLFFSTQREYELDADPPPPRGSPLRSDGVDGTGDANQTRVLVTHKTTGRGGQATLGSIQTHSPRRLNSRRVVNAEQEVG